MSCGYDLTVHTGETFNLALFYKDQDGNPIDILNDSCVLTIDSTTYTSPSPEISIGPEVNAIRILLPTAEVATYGTAILPYSLLLVDSDLPAGSGDVLLLEGLMQFE